MPTTILALQCLHHSHHRGHIGKDLHRLKLYLQCCGFGAWGNREEPAAAATESAWLLTMEFARSSE